MICIDAKCGLRYAPFASISTQTRVVWVNMDIVINLTTLLVWTGYPFCWLLSEVLTFNSSSSEMWVLAKKNMYLTLFEVKWGKKLQIWQHCTKNLATLLVWEFQKWNHSIPHALKYGNTCQSRFSRSIRSKVITDSLSKYENND